MKSFGALCVAVITCVHAQPPATVNLRPIIGVLANGPNDTSIHPPYTVHDSYIAASYIKWIEAAGGRAVPIPWFIEESALRRLMKYLNGFLFPGGGVHFFSPPNGTELSPYGRTTKIIFDEVVSAWQNGETVSCVPPHCKQACAQASASRRQEMTRLRGARL